MTADDVRQMEEALERIYGPIPRYTPRRKATRWVYFARAGELVKIGQSTNPARRVEHLRTANPGIELLAVLPGGIHREKELHRQFAHLRVRREWFFHRDGLAAFIKAIPGSPEQTP